MLHLGHRNRCFRWVLAPLVAALLASAATAQSPHPGELRGARGFHAARGWLDADPLRVPLPLPEPSFATRLRWQIADLAPAPPAATGLRGWLPSILLLGALATAQFALDPPADSRWTDRNGFDSAIRRPLRGGSRDTREDAALASDILFAGMGAALAADWWWLRGEHGLLRSVQVDTRWLLADNLITRGAKVGAGRQRPYVQPCGRDDDYVPACGNGREGNTSFFSGHASNAATLAGLLCARHLHRRDADAGDALICGGAAAGALATGVLRIVSEHHFATDVIAGWVAGAFFGYYLPSRFDYLGEPGDALALSAFTPLIGRDFYGFQYGFRF
jgi:membrane-associated phospholipid phosphatase